MREVWFGGNERSEEQGLEEGRGRTWNRAEAEGACGDLLLGSKVEGLMNHFTVTL